MDLLRWFFRRTYFLILWAFIATGVFVAINFEELLDHYAPLDLREPPGWLTNTQLYYLRASPEKCFTVLTRSEVAFNRQQYPLNDRGCGFEKAGAGFLRAVRDGACRFFGGMLSPDYNAAHANHFHFDMGWWKICR